MFNTCFVECDTNDVMCVLRAFKKKKKKELVVYLAQLWQCGTLTQILENHRNLNMLFTEDSLLDKYVGTREKRIRTLSLYVLINDFTGLQCSCCSACDMIWILKIACTCKKYYFEKQKD